MTNRRTLALLVMLIAVCGVSLLVYRWANRPRATARTGVGDSRASALTGAAAAVLRVAPDAVVPRVSPYAVVLHGICVPSNDPDQQKASRKKWEALLRDAFWQSAFSGVNPEEFYLVKTSLPLHRYVTYRKMENGQEIHWTGRKILIPAGTRVFTDGQGDMYLCTCGNQVAAALPPRMQGTVLPPEEEPPVAYLVPLEPEPFPGIPRGLPGATPLAPPEVATATHSNESESILPTPPIFEGGPSPWENWPRPGPNPKPPSHPVAVPESSTFSLIPIAFCAIILALYFSKRR